MEQTNENVEKATIEAGKLLVRTLITKLRNEGKVDTGELINSISYSVIQSAKGTILDLNASEELKFIDQGRKKGTMPPVSAITKWAKNKGIRIKDTTAEQTGFIIAKSISNKGIKPTHIIKETIDQIINDVKVLISNGFREDMVDLVNNELKNIDN